MHTRHSLLTMAAAVSVLLTTSAQAHDVRVQPATGQPAAQWAPARLKYMPLDRVPRMRNAAPLGLIDLKSVIVLPNKWAQTQAIRVCFVGGSPELRDRILKVAGTWIAYTNLKLESGGPGGVTCQPQDRSEVRIGFSEPGYWSYIGNDSLYDELVSNSLTSMNFGGYDRNPPAEPEFSGIILHEWGHALGLHHEHQSPASGCDAEYNWPAVYQYYQTHYGWDQKMVDTNLKPLIANRSAYDWSDKDPNSIMIYASDPQFLFKGTGSPCYFHSNDKLSAMDIKGIARAYPRSNPALALELQANTVGVTLNKGLDPNLEKALARQHKLATEKLQAFKQMKQQ
jgi:hypothetical protein